MQTRRGLEIGTDDPEVVAAADDFIDRLARIAKGADAILPAVARHPEVASLQLYAALLYLYAQTDDATLTTLVNALSPGNFKDREAAAKALGATEDPRAVPVLQTVHR